MIPMHQFETREGMESITTIRCEICDKHIAMFYSDHLDKKPSLMFEYKPLSSNTTRMQTLVIIEGYYHFCCHAHRDQWVRENWPLVKKTLDTPIPQDDYADITDAVKEVQNAAEDATDVSEQDGAELEEV
jgi:hypothetical protein